MRVALLLLVIIKKMQYIYLMLMMKKRNGINDMDSYANYFNGLQIQYLIYQVEFLFVLQELGFLFCQLSTL